ncbi:hypothetical protein ACFTQL_07185 [Peribacillus butanolivorans]|uniref:hypothetical protein n=1 Tax=Peribacillus butanolivorans TaxID=421767 RepID=UPI00363003B5
MPLQGQWQVCTIKWTTIPKEWLEKITIKEDIDELIMQFHSFCADKAIKEEYGD